MTRSLLEGWETRVRHLNENALAESDEQAARYYSARAAELQDCIEALRAQAEAAPTCETCRHWIRIEGGDQQCPYTFGRCTRMQDEDYPYPHEPIVVYSDAAPYWVWTMPTASCSMHALAQADAADQL